MKSDRDMASRAEPLSHEAAPPVPPPPAPPAEVKRATRKEILKIALQLGAGVVGLFAVIALVAYLFREQLESLGSRFVGTFGIAGMGIGTYFADALHFPIPPQFYMLASITAHENQVLTLTAISIASLLGGTTGFFLSRRASRFRWLDKLLARSRPKVDRLFTRWGYWAVAIGSITPIPYSTLCYAAGLYRMPFRIFAFLALFRVPRLLVIYLIVRLGWGG